MVACQEFLERIQRVTRVSMTEYKAMRKYPKGSAYDKISPRWWETLEEAGLGDVSTTLFVFVY